MTHLGSLFAEKGVVHLIEREELPEEPGDSTSLWLLTQQLAREMDKGGCEGAARFLKENPIKHESIKALAYRLYTIAEKNNWASEAYVYNTLVTSWPEIQNRLTELNNVGYEVQELF